MKYKFVDPKSVDLTPYEKRPKKKEIATLRRAEKTGLKKIKKQNVDFKAEINTVTHSSTDALSTQPIIPTQNSTRNLSCVPVLTLPSSGSSDDNNHLLDGVEEADSDREGDQEFWQEVKKQRIH